ncbi:MAG: glycosyltransferase family 2 protein [Bacteroidota bacterium]
MIVVASLYALATLVLVAFGISLGVLATLRVRRHRPVLRVEPQADEAWPDVLVQVPVYNEPPTVVARALAALAAQEYPGDLSIQLLDDSTDGSISLNRASCDALADRGIAIEHRTRATRDGYKAGALAAGLEASNAPLVAVFDADFSPQPDFLRRMVPALLASDDLAFVQARWTHPKADHTLLGRVQAALLDLHFVVEQGGRDRAGWPIVFNGTAGIWRRSAIEDAGGWNGDTLAEDQDLALRAHLAGWKARLLDDVEAPADLPPTLHAWRTQQHRWLKGTSEVRRALWGRVLQSPLRASEKLSISAQLAMPFTIPALLTVILLHPVLAWAHATGTGPGDLFFAALSAGYVALVGAVVAHSVVQRTLYPEAWLRRTVVRLPLVFAAPLGLVVPGTLALLEAQLGRKTPFVRTPKTPLHQQARIRWPEAVLALASSLGAIVLAAVGAWGPLMFQSLFVVGLAAVAWTRPTVRTRAWRAPWRRPVPTTI